MRTMIAMICAVAAAALVTFTISQNVADNVVASYHFDNPDSVADLHTAVFLATSAAGLVLGWLAGWLLAWPFRRRPPVA